MSENQEPDAVGRDENKGNLGMAIPKRFIGRLAR